MCCKNRQSVESENKLISTTTAAVLVALHKPPCNNSTAVTVFPNLGISNRIGPGQSWHVKSIVMLLLNFWIKVRSCPKGLHGQVGQIKTNWIQTTEKRLAFLLALDAALWTDHDPDLAIATTAVSTSIYLFCLGFARPYTLQPGLQCAPTAAASCWFVLGRVRAVVVAPLSGVELPLCCP